MIVKIKGNIIIRTGIFDHDWLDKLNDDRLLECSELLVWAYGQKKFLQREWNFFFELEIIIFYATSLISALIWLTS
jgi:hypothetical protein